jgi:hypothetical protein
MVLPIQATQSSFKWFVNYNQKPVTETSCLLGPASQTGKVKIVAIMGIMTEVCFTE